MGQYLYYEDRRRKEIVKEPWMVGLRIPKENQGENGGTGSWERRELQEGEAVNSDKCCRERRGGEEGREEGEEVGRGRGGGGEEREGLGGGGGGEGREGAQ